MLVITKGNHTDLTIGAKFAPNPLSMLSFERIFREAVYSFGPLDVSVRFGLNTSLSDLDDVVFGKRPIGGAGHFDHFSRYQVLTGTALDPSRLTKHGVRAQISNQKSVRHFNLRGHVVEDAVAPLPFDGSNGSEVTASFPTSFVLHEQGTSSGIFVPQDVRTPVVFSNGLYEFAAAASYLTDECYEDSPLWWSDGTYQRIGPLDFYAVDMGSYVWIKHILYYVRRPAGGKYLHSAIIREEVIWVDQTLPLSADTEYSYADAFSVQRVAGYAANSVSLTSPSGTPAYNSALQSLYAGLTVHEGSLSPGITQYLSGETPEVWSHRIWGAGATRSLIGLERNGWVNHHPDSFKAFQESFLALQTDIHFCGALAAWNALEEGCSSMGINQLESSQDFWGLLSLVDIIQVLKRVRELEQGNPVIIWDILDLLADVQLLYSYALAPTYDDYQVIAEKAVAVRDNWKAFCRKQTLYGSQTLDVPDHPGWLLKVGATVRLGVQADALLSVLPAYAAGFLPTLSTLWENIPFSFLLDRLFPTGKALSWVDNTVFMQCFDIDWVTLTYRLVNPISEEVLLDRGILPYQGETEFSPEVPGVEYTGFDRCVLPHMPFLGPSRILSGALTSQLLKFDWLTTGALAYRLFR